MTTPRHIRTTDGDLEVSIHLVTGSHHQLDRALAALEWLLDRPTRRYSLRTLRGTRGGDVFAVRYLVHVILGGDPHRL